jgi:probable HAF family extracellular repeat protein
MAHRIVAWTFACLAVTAASAAFERPAYQLRRLPAPEGCGAYAGWHGLSGDGRALMVVACEGAPGVRAIRWAAGRSVELAAPGAPIATPYGLGPGDVVVGSAETADLDDDGPRVARPVVWENGSARDLGTLGGTLGGALAINAHGTIVGACQAEGTEPWLPGPMRACAWSSGGVVRDLGDLGGTHAAAYDINDRGWIVGSSAMRVASGAAFEEHAFLLAGKKMRDLGTLGGQASFAWAINERGDVVGASYTGEPAPPGEVSFRAFLWRGNTLRDLGTLGGSISEALDVNDDGLIVGWSRLQDPVDGEADHAVIWLKEIPLDLNDLIVEAHGCVVTRATSIDAAGSILADARCFDGNHVVILERH